MAGAALLISLALVALGIIHPALLFAAGLFALGGAIDFADASAHTPDGGNYAWVERIDKVTGAVVTFGGQISAVKVTNPGSGYDAVTIGFTGGGGSGAAATGLLQGGKLLAITITNAGTGYTTVPTVTITPTTTGSGAAATAYLTDGWHRLPARASHNFKSGQPETDVISEDKRIFTTKKEAHQGSITFAFQQMDTWTRNFLFKEANDYDWRLFLYDGLSRNNFFHAYQLIGRVRFPKLADDQKPKDTLDVTASVLNNPTAITITEANLPVASLAQAYDLAANEVYIEQEELIEPTT